MNLQSKEAELLRLAECCLILTLLPPTDARRDTTPLSSLFVLLAPLTSLPYIVISIHRSWMTSAVLFHSHLSYTTKYFTSLLLYVFNPCLLSTIIINCLYSSDIPIVLLFLFFYMYKSKPLCFLNGIVVEMY